MHVYHSNTYGDDDWVLFKRINIEFKTANVSLFAHIMWV